MIFERRYLGRLRFYGEKVRQAIMRLAGMDGAVGGVPQTMEELNLMKRASKTRLAIGDRALRTQPQTRA